jgi:hypothetical protein
MKQLLAVVLTLIMCMSAVVGLTEGSDSGAMKQLLELLTENPELLDYLQGVMNAGINAEQQSTVAPIMIINNPEENVQMKLNTQREIDGICTFTIKGIYTTNEFLGNSSGAMDEYLVLDIEVINTSLTELDVSDKINASLSYNSKYSFYFEALPSLTSLLVGNWVSSDNDKYTFQVDSIVGKTITGSITYNDERMLSTGTIDASNLELTIQANKWLIIGSIDPKKQQISGAAMAEYFYRSRDAMNLQVLQNTAIHLVSLVPNAVASDLSNATISLDIIESTYEINDISRFYVDAPKPLTHYAIVDNPGASDRLNIRAEPSTASMVLTKLNNNEIVEVLNQNGEWWQVRLANGEIGYALAKYLKLIQ